MAKKNKFQLSEEQDLFIKEALSGKNIFVDACIGSGKTTAIQKLCNKYETNKKILYLTYNKLLKIDAQSKIKKKNILVQNYHGYSYVVLKDIGVTAGQSVLIQKFLKLRPNIVSYDVLIIDEYQDITQEISDLLKYIKSFNPAMQIIAVGDMEQKIYDYTTLDVLSFIKNFLGDYKKLEFTKCFRLSQDLASMLGRIWHKSIVGVNENCIVEELDLKDVINLLSKQKPKDILCLGKNGGQRDILLNTLETIYPKIFNKNTVFAKISENESLGVIRPNNSSAIFTTFDSCKGLEKNFCVLCDFTEKYWNNRLDMPNTRYEILRNIFCVAASRGKARIIFLKNDTILSEKTLSTYVATVNKFNMFEMSNMFEFKYREDIKRCYEELDIERINTENTSVISINSNDGLIDLSPCIGNYQEAVFFKNYDIDMAIQSKMCLESVKKELNDKTKIVKDVDLLIEKTEEKIEKQYNRDIINSTLDEKILYLTMLDTKQERYRKQVKVPFVSDKQKELIINRLKTHFNMDEKVQVECRIECSYNGGSQKFQAIGYSDVIKNNIVYELKFVSELMPEHFLQCACYVVALKLEKGILWNTKDNSMYSITIPNRKEFLNSVIRAITKGVITEYYNPNKNYIQYNDKGELQAITSKRAVNEYWKNQEKNNEKLSLKNKDKKRRKLI